MTTDTSEKGLESLIMLHMSGVAGFAPEPEGRAAETPDAISAAKAAGSGWLAGNPKDYDRTYTIDPILDTCVAVYLRLDEDGQVDFKGKAKSFVRTYDFLASVLPYTNREWEKLSIVLNLLIPKLPAPREEDLSKGILEAIDMDSYRVEKRAVLHITPLDADAEIGPVPVEGGGTNATRNWTA